MDPFLDDNVTMAKRLQSLGKKVGLNVLSGLPHGFLNCVNVIISFEYSMNSVTQNFIIGKLLLIFFLFKKLKKKQISKEADEGNQLCISHLAELLSVKSDSNDRMKRKNVGA